MGVLLSSVEIVEGDCDACYKMNGELTQGDQTLGFELDMQEQAGELTLKIGEESFTNSLSCQEIQN